MSFKTPSIFLRISDILADPCVSGTLVPPSVVDDACVSYSIATADRKREDRKRRQGVASWSIQKCNLCSKEYRTIGALKMHMRTHSPPCLCGECGKSFSRPWLLKGHLRTHTGERPYQCGECHRKFADRSNLRAHEHTHRSERRHKCSFCLQTFARGNVRARHEEACAQRRGSQPVKKPVHEDVRGQPSESQPTEESCHEEECCQWMNSQPAKKSRRENICGQQADLQAVKQPADEDVCELRRNSPVDESSFEEGGPHRDSLPVQRPRLEKSCGQRRDPQPVKQPGHEESCDQRTDSQTLEKSLNKEESGRRKGSKFNQEPRSCEVKRNRIEANLFMVNSLMTQNTDVEVNKPLIALTHL